MEQELNIAEILKDKPKGTKLYSSIFGICTFDEITYDECCFGVKTYDNVSETFYSDGKYDKNGECTIFPSKKMQDWDKFAWKKGDILQISSIGFCTFEKWTSDDYTTFKGRYGVGLGKNNDHDYDVKKNLTTSMWYKVDNNDFIKEYLSTVERRFGGKLNQSTLEIEKSEFKDGDIFTLDDNETYIKTIGIFKGYNNDGRIKVYAAYNMDRGIDYINVATYDRTIHPATDSEKRQLFSALEKYGKRWNSETKTLEDLPKKCELEPFDKVLARTDKNGVWVADLFSHLNNERDCFKYACIGATWRFCIPYNEQTAHLLGTTDDFNERK